MGNVLYTIKRPLSAEPTSMKTIGEKYYNTFQSLKSIKVADLATPNVWQNKTLLLRKRRKLVLYNKFYIVKV